MAGAMAQPTILSLPSSPRVAFEVGNRSRRDFPCAGMQRCLTSPPEVQMEANVLSGRTMRAANGLSGRTMRAANATGRVMNLSNRELLALPGCGVRRGAGCGLEGCKGRTAAGPPRKCLDLVGSSRRRGGGAGRIEVAKSFGFASVAVRDVVGRSARRCWQVRAVETDPNSGNKNPVVEKGTEILHLGVSLGAFLAIDRLLKEQFLAAGIRFPSALFGMFCIFTFLNVADAIKPEVAAAFISFFQPAIIFIQRWLPLFYVPSLVVVPLAIQGIPTAAAAKIALIFVGGWAASLAVAGYTTMVVRNIVKTEMQPAEYTPKPAPFADWELKALAAAVVVFFGLAMYSPTALGTTSLTVLPFFLSATALGYVFGSNLPADARKIFHPIITCAITADVAAYAYGYMSKIGFEEALKLYLTKQAGNPGAGDVFMGVLGSVILSFAFSMFYQRKLVKRHAAEIFTAVATAGVFSLYSTAAAGRLLGLPSNLTLAIVPRCITVALALPIASLLEAGNPSVTAAVVVLTGLVGANFTQVVMDKLRFSDPISRGMATASSAHGLGTAALSAKEPEALPFCAIAYALTGIFCSVLVSVPAVQRSLLLLAGAL